jgi:hypothetical protein
LLISQQSNSASAPHVRIPDSNLSTLPQLQEEPQREEQYERLSQQPTFLRQQERMEQLVQQQQLQLQLQQQQLQQQQQQQQQQLQEMRLISMILLQQQQQQQQQLPRIPRFQELLHNHQGMVQFPLSLPLQRHISLLSPSNWPALQQQPTPQQQLLYPLRLPQSQSQMQMLPFSHPPAAAAERTFQDST